MAMPGSDYSEILTVCRRHTRLTQPLTDRNHRGINNL